MTPAQLQQVQGFEGMSTSPVRWDLYFGKLTYTDPTLHPRLLA